MELIGAREAHRKAHQLPGPITQTDQLLLAIHQELVQLRQILTPREPEPQPEIVALREPATPAKPAVPAKQAKRTK